VLFSKHRAAPASAPVYLDLVATNAETTHLEVIADLGELSRAELQDSSTRLTVNGKQRGLEERVLELLARGVILTRGKLRDSLGVKNERLGEALESLERAGRPALPHGWWLATP
jgi:hypothetical protein